MKLISEWTDAELRDHADELGPPVRSAAFAAEVLRLRGELELLRAGRFVGDPLDQLELAEAALDRARALCCGPGDRCRGCNRWDCDDLRAAIESPEA